MHTKVLYYRAVPQRGSRGPRKNLRFQAVFAALVDSIKDDRIFPVAIRDLQRLEQQCQRLWNEQLGFTDGLYDQKQ